MNGDTLLAGMSGTPSKTIVLAVVELAARSDDMCIGRYRGPRETLGGDRFDF